MAKLDELFEAVPGALVPMPDSVALVEDVGAAGNPLAAAAVLVVGNLIVIVLEGLVVSIQTTRLVLFEFFTRFFRPEGREFRPLAAPPVTLGH